MIDLQDLVCRKMPNTRQLLKEVGQINHANRNVVYIDIGMLIFKQTGLCFLVLTGATVFPVWREVLKAEVFNQPHFFSVLLSFEDTQAFIFL